MRGKSITQSLFLMQHLGKHGSPGKLPPCYLSSGSAARKAKDRQVIHRREQKLMLGVNLAIVLPDGS